MRSRVVLRRLKQFSLIFGVWTLAALPAAIQSRLYQLSVGKHIGWRQALTIPLINWWIYALLTPGVLWLSRRYPFRRPGILKASAVHLLASIGFGFLHATLRVLVYPIHDPMNGSILPRSWALVRMLFISFSYDDMWMYGTVLVVAHLWEYYGKFKDRELRASKLETELAQAQLSLLRMQLHPHFLFNTLHTISSLMREDVEAADDMITHLSDLLRMSLENVNEQRVPLRREVEILEGYLKIQQTRFRDRLKVCLEIEPATLDALVPNMILQPLVENAVVHGITPRSAPGELRVEARRADGVLRISVADNGKGLPDGFTEQGLEGVGLSNTRARLLQLYGDRQRFELRNAPEGGVVATIEMPFSTEISHGDQT